MGNLYSVDEQKEIHRCLVAQNSNLVLSLVSGDNKAKSMALRTSQINQIIKIKIDWPRG